MIRSSGCAGLVSAGAVAEYHVDVADVGGGQAVAGVLDDVGIHVDGGDVAFLTDQVCEQRSVASSPAPISRT